MPSLVWALWFVSWVIIWFSVAAHGSSGPFEVPLRIHATDLGNATRPVEWFGLSKGNNGNATFDDAVDDLDVYGGSSLPHGADTSGYLLRVTRGMSVDFKVHFPQLAFYMFRARVLQDDSDAESDPDGKLLLAGLFDKGTGENLLPYPYGLWAVNASSSPKWETISELTTIELNGEHELVFHVPNESHHVAFLLDFVALYPHLPHVIPGTIPAELYRKWGHFGFDIETAGNQGDAPNYYDDVDVYLGSSIGLPAHARAIRLNAGDGYVRYDVYVEETAFYQPWLKVRPDHNIGDCSDGDVDCEWRTASVYFDSTSTELHALVPWMHLADPDEKGKWHNATHVPVVQMEEGFADVLLYANSGEYFVEEIVFEKTFPFLNVTEEEVSALSYRKFGPYRASSESVDIVSEGERGKGVRMKEGEWLRYDAYIDAEKLASNEMELQISGWVESSAGIAEPALVLAWQDKDKGEVVTIARPVVLTALPGEVRAWCTRVNSSEVPGGPQELLLFSGSGEFILKAFSLVTLEKGSDSALSRPLCHPPMLKVPDLLAGCEASRIESTVDGALAVGTRLTRVEAEPGVYETGAKLRDEDAITYELRTDSRSPVNVSTLVNAESDKHSTAKLEVVLLRSSTTLARSEPVTLSADGAWQWVNATIVGFRDTEELVLNNVGQTNVTIARVKADFTSHELATNVPARLEVNNATVVEDTDGMEQVDLPHVLEELPGGNQAMVLRPDVRSTWKVRLGSSPPKLAKAKFLQLDCCDSCKLEVTVFVGEGLLSYVGHLENSGGAARLWAAEKVALEAAGSGSAHSPGIASVWVESIGRATCLLWALDVSSGDGEWPQGVPELQGETEPNRPAQTELPGEIEAVDYTWWEFDGHGGKGQDVLPINQGPEKDAPGPADVFPVPGREQRAVMLRAGEWVKFAIVAATQLGGSDAEPFQLTAAEKCGEGADTCNDGASVVLEASDGVTLAEWRVLGKAFISKGASSSSSIPSGPAELTLKCTAGKALVASANLTAAQTATGGNSSSSSNSSSSVDTASRVGKMATGPYAGAAYGVIGVTGLSVLVVRALYAKRSALLHSNHRDAQKSEPA